MCVVASMLLHVQQNNHMALLSFKMCSPTEKYLTEVETI